MDKVFFYSFDEEIFYNITCKTKEDVFEEVLFENRPAFENSEVDGIWIGIGVKAPHPEISAERVLEWLRDNAEYDDFDGSTDNYLNDVSSEQLNELKDLLNIAYEKWERKHKQQPTWYKIENVTYYFYDNGKFKKGE